MDDELLEKHYTARKIAYFSMEIALQDEIKTYAGGLGILAGDTLKTAADMGIDMMGVCILYKYGYFKQEFDDNLSQKELPDIWDYEKYLQNTGKEVIVHTNQGDINIEIWKYEIVGLDGHSVPIYFLNTDIEKNEEKFRYISYNLYTPYEETNLWQVITLGIGGVKAVNAIYGTSIDIYHLNESHASFGILELRKDYGLFQEVRSKVRFTTHTPAEHGHKIFSKNHLASFLDSEYMQILEEEFDEDENLHLTKFSLKHSSSSNAVSKRHTEISYKMFPDKYIESITNGMHVGTWAGKATEEVFDEYLSGWRHEPRALKKAISIPYATIVEMHRRNKSELLDFVKERTGVTLKEHVFTIGFARRVDGYKRWGFVTKHLAILQAIAQKNAGLQIIFAGKSYPDYENGEAEIREILRLTKMDLGALSIVFIPDYSMTVGKMMVQGVDLWLNNPIKPLEASGTSGMKAALNGVPNFSTVDGWWLEGWEEGITGWSIGDESISSQNDEYELYDLYSKLEYVILPMFHRNQISWYNIMKNAIAKNASYFNTHRMLYTYIKKSYNV